MTAVMDSGPVTAKEFRGLRHLVIRLILAVIVGAIAIGVIVMVGAIVVNVQVNRIRTLQHEQRETNIDSQVKSCENQADFRHTFAEVLGLVAHPVSTTRPASIDLSNVPGFNKLDANEQQFMRNVSTTLAGQAGNPEIATVLAQYQKRFPVPDCAQLRKHLEQSTP